MKAEGSTRTENFDNVTTIVVMLNRMIGVRTFDHSNTRLWLFLSFLYKAIIVSCCLCFLYFDGTYEMTLTFNYLGPVVYMTMTILGVMSIISMQILGWQYKKEMSLLRKNIADTEQSLMKLNVAIDHRYIYIWTVVICIVTGVDGFLFCLFYGYMRYYQKENALTLFSDTLHSIFLYVGGMVVLDFTTHVCWLRKSFKQTNDLLKMFFIEDCPIEMEDWNNKMVASWLQRCLNEWRIGHFVCRNKVTPFSGTRMMEQQMCTLNKINTLQQIRYIHLQLCAITKLLSKIFDAQIMLHSMLTIYGVVAILYYIYTELVINSLQSHNSVNTLSCYLLDTMYAWLKVVVTCYFCEKTAKEAKQIVHIIHVCSIHNSDIGLKNELVQFCQQVSLTEVNLETRHLFRLNDGFILQSMGSIFTYFLIMIQWSQMVDVHGSSSNLTAIN